ncbi:MAG: hypothetical protein HY722_14535 [Planctomycetes bacterium]|nr:hypothetical protein [Planctomycetota bacterium]
MSRPSTGAGRPGPCRHRRFLSLVGLHLVLAAPLAACRDPGGAPQARLFPAASAATPPASTALAGGPTAAAAGPVVAIRQPRDGDRLDLGQAVRLEGVAVDAAGMPLPASALQWTSSLDGPLGRGPVATVAALSPGLHDVGLAATDSQGRTGRSAVRVLVAGAGGRTGTDLAAYLLGLPRSILGQPYGFPPDFHSMVAANPTDLNATTGAGGMAAGFSSAGTLTVLRWPNPSCYDQVNYLAVPGRPPGFGALENMGVFAGVVLPLGTGRTVSWLRDPTWTTTQRYLDDEADVVVTSHESAALGLRVTQTGFVRPDRDVLVLGYEVARLPGGPDAVSLVLFENLAPCTTRFPYLPLADWALDLANDFAAAYSERDDAVVHFRPDRADPLRLAGFALSGGSRRRADVEAWLDAADGSFGTGAYLALGGEDHSDGVQVGPDSAGVARAGAASAVDAYADASDGLLSGNPFAAVRATAAFSRRLDLSAGGASTTWYLAAGPSLDGPAGARTLLAWARSTPYAAHRSAALADWRAWMARARLPSALGGPEVLRLARRGLVATRTATDRSGGAIVASIATQLPYGLDWPRDGAFINRALDEAGYPEVVTRHNEFYARVQRKGLFLPGTYEMNYYADGTPGGPILFEIDNAALAVWTLADHLDFIADPVERARHQAVVYPAIRRGAGFLASWRDPISRLQLPANEDDHPELTQGIQGAETICLALEAALRAGAAAGEDPRVLDAWRHRRDELRDALLARFWDPALGRLADRGGSSSHGLTDSGTGAWALWPCPVLLPGDPRRAAEADYLWRDLGLTFSGARGRSAYDLKGAVALAEAWAADPVRRAGLADLVRRAALEMPTPGTGHLGEMYEIQALGPGRLLFRQVNDMPHIWEHALFYLAARRLY